MGELLASQEVLGDRHAPGDQVRSRRLRNWASHLVPGESKASVPSCWLNSATRVHRVVLVWGNDNLGNVDAARRGPRFYTDAELQAIA